MFKLVEPFFGCAFIGPLLGGIFGGLGALGGAMINSSSQKDANVINQEMAREQMAFQERMSNSAFQRGTDDMRKAGINPVMAYSQGGASAPPGAQARVESEMAGEGLKNAASSAMEIMAIKKGLEETDSRIELNKASEQAKHTEAELNKNSAKNTDIVNKKLKAELPAYQAEKAYEKARAEADIPWAKADSVGGRLLKALGGISDAVNVKRLFGGSGSSTPHGPGGGVRVPGDNANWRSGYSKGYSHGKAGK